MTPSDARRVLGLSEKFSKANLKYQYRKKVLISHPDRNKGDNKKFLLVQRAYQLLLSNAQNPIKPTKPSYSQRPNVENVNKTQEYYYVKNRKTSTQIAEENWGDFKSNLIYFLTAIGLIIASLFILFIPSMFEVESPLLGLIIITGLMVILVKLVHKFAENQEST